MSPRDTQPRLSPRSLRRSALSLGAVAAALALAACGASAPSSPNPKTKKATTVDVAATGNVPASNMLTIYSSLQLQGADQATNDSVNDAEQLALEQARGRVGKYAIRYIQLDNSISSTAAWNTATVQQNARQAADDSSAIAYIGEDTSGATEASMPILNRAGILQMSPEATDTSLTTDGTGQTAFSVLYPTGRRTFARVVPNNSVEAQDQAAYQQAEGCQRTFIVTDGGVYGVNLVAGLKSAVPGADVSIVGTHQIGASQTSFTKVVAAVTAAGADCVFYGGNIDNNTVALWNALGTVPSAPKLFGPDALAEESFADSISPTVQDRTFITAPGLAPSALNDLGQTFYSEYEARFGGFPDPEAIFGYETMELILSAIRNAAAEGGVSRAAVIKQIFATSDRDSVLGTYSVKADGDTTMLGYGAYVVQQGALVFSHGLQPTGT
jgi:branched-chain amino acid transport system substrate-binding protein